MKLFKVKTNYLKNDNTSENGSKMISEVRLFQSIDYIDAQSQAIAFINKLGCMGECECDIQKISYDDIIFYLDKSKENEEEYYWYEIRVTQLFINDKNEEKYLTKKYIVEGEDLEDALDNTRNYLKTKHDFKEESWWFTSVTETNIEEIITSKDVKDF